MRVLLVEDNERLTTFISGRFAAVDIAVDAVTNAADGLRATIDVGYDACIVDRMLPGGTDGLELVAQLRARGDGVPILVLSALAEVEERVRGLRAGADDYLTKPFDFDELHARIMAVGRRRQQPAEAVELSLADLVMNLRAHTVKRNGQVIPLRPMEFRVLEYLLRHAGQVVTRRMLLERVWDHGFDPGTNIIDVQMSKLRGKIDAGFDKPLLHTVRSIGYMLSDAR